MRRVASLPLIGFTLGAVLLAAPPGAVACPQLLDAPPQAEPAGTARLTITVVASDTGAPVKQVLVTLFGTVLPAAPTAGAPVGSATLSGTVQGRVVLSGVPAPARDAQQPPPPPGQVRREAQTDEQGRLEFTSLPRGQYSLSVAPPSPFVRPRTTRSTVLGDGEARSLVVSLQRGGVITGRLLDERGDPVVGASVTALTSRETYAGRRPVGRQAISDDRGQYRIFDLPPGEYLVLATHRPLVRPSPAGQPPSSGHVPTYFPGIAAPDDARSITVRTGEEVANVDFALVEGRLGRLQVRLLDSRGAPVTRAGLALADRRFGLGPTALYGRNTAAGTFLFDAVPVGDYILTAQGVSPRADGQPGYSEGLYTPVRVDDHDEQLEVRTNEGARLSGRIRLEGAAPGTIASGTAGPVSVGRHGVSLMVRPIRNLSPGFSPGRAEITDDGTFRIIGVRGTVTLTAGTGVGVMRSVRRGASDLLETPLELTGTEDIDDIEVVVTTETGSVAGTVVDGGGEAVPGAWLVLFGENSKYWFMGSPYVRPSQTMTPELLAARPSPIPQSGAARLGTRPPDEAAAIPRSPGRFGFPRLLPGRYYVAVLPQAEGDGLDADWLDKANLERLRAQAATVTVVAGEVTEMVVRTDK